MASYTLADLQTLRNNGPTYSEPIRIIFRENSTTEQYILDATTDICNNVITTIRDTSANHYFYPFKNVLVCNGDISTNANSIVSNVQNIFPDLTVKYLDLDNIDSDIGLPYNLVIEYENLHGIAVKWDLTG